MPHDLGVFMRLRIIIATLLLPIVLTACDRASEGNFTESNATDPIDTSDSETNPDGANDLEEYLAFLDTLEGDDLALELAKDEQPFEIPPELGAAHPITENINLGRWGDLIEWPEIATGAANLPDGRLLTWAATSTTGFGGESTYTFGSIFDPVTETFSDMPNENHNHFCAGVSLLADGSVFAPGGGETITTNSIFDGNSWSLSDPLNVPRWYPQSTTLPSGQVFTALGSSSTGVSELWTQGEGWELMPNANLDSVLNDETAPANKRWWYPALNVTPDGSLFHPGPTSELFSFDLHSNDAVRTDFGKREEDHSMRLYNTTVMYDVGKMLLAGGGEPAVNTAMTIDLNGSAPIITPIESMTYARSMQNSVVLPDGKVLVIGGTSVGKQFSDSGTQMIPEMWDPKTGQWSVLAPQNVPRNYHSTALLLKDGRVAAMGGGLCGRCLINQKNGEIFEPPYLFNDDGTRAVQPQITSGPEEAIAGESLTFSATPGIASFSMLRLVAITHHHTTDQRFIPLDFFETSPGNFEVQLPSNENVLIPGNYWVFALNANGVPSEGSTLLINPTASAVVNLIGDENPPGTPGDESSGGVEYEYYEGNWSALPNFNSLTPVATGQQNGFSLNNAQRGDFFGFRFTAELEITNNGIYTFYTKSDDGSQLFIDGQLVVDNNGLHAAIEKQGSINLGAGVHEIVVTYFEKTGQSSLDVQMEGPSFTKQDVQNAIVTPTDGQSEPDSGQSPGTGPETPGPSGGGEISVAYEYFEGNWNTLPNFDDLTPVLTGTQADFGLTAAQQNDLFAFRFTAELELAESGTYTFYSASDDGSQVFINGDLVVDNNGIHPAIETQGSVNLNAGVHEIEVTFFEKYGRNSLSVQLEGPSIAKQDAHNFVISSATGSLPGPAGPSGEGPNTQDPSDPSASAADGVTYEYYEGNWNTLPNFDDLTPVLTGTQADFGLTAAQQNDLFAFRFTAELELAESGTYTFYSASDDGSQVFINGDLVVDNNGIHPAIETQGSVNLNAGVHEIEVTFFEKYGRNSLSVQLEGPSIAKQDAHNFVISSATGSLPDPAGPTDAGSEGVAYEYFEGNWNTLPNFDNLTPVATGTQTDFSLTEAQQNDLFAFRFTAQLELYESGVYTFYTASDDGSQVFINGNLVVNNDGLHPAIEEQGSINLSAGVHEIVVTYFEKYGRSSLELQLEGPSTTKQGIQSFLVADD